MSTVDNPAGCASGARLFPFHDSESIDFGEPTTPKRWTAPEPRLLDTPTARTANSARDVFLEQNAEARQARLASECKTCCVGPMPIKLFCKTVLPNYEEVNAITKGGIYFKSVPILKKGEDEAKLYTPLCKEFNALWSKFKLVDTHNHAETSGLGSLRPDLLLYGKDVADNFKIRGGVYRCNFGSSELFVEIKGDQSSDPLTDPAKNEEVEEVELFRSRKGKQANKSDTETVGQTVSYATELCARQHRTHCFSISIYNSYARIFRWDRSGVIASTAFNYHKTPWLSIFAQQYNRATNADRGHDVTIAKASEDEESRFVDIVTKHIKKQLCPDDKDLSVLLDTHYEKNKVYKVTLRPQPQSEVHRFTPNLKESENLNNTQQDSVAPEHVDSTQSGSQNNKEPFSIFKKYQNVQYFLISRPVAAPLSCAGRGTRGYWSVKSPDASIGETEYQIAFLKDTWRIAAQGVEKEGDIILELLAAGVPYVSDIFGQGDVMIEDGGEMKDLMYQRTMTDEYQSAAWNCNKTLGSVIAPHVHYRMALTEVGYPLKNLLGTKELVHATFTAFTAAWEAFKRCNRIHRDISINNIILVKEGETWRIGYLIDWELSCKNDSDALPRNYRRSASWAFMPVKTLRGTNTYKHTFEDDMESFFYVILYASLRWLPHTFSGDLVKEMRLFFDDCRERRGMIVGGAMKSQNLLDYCFVGTFHWKSPELSNWIHTALDLQKKDINNKGQAIWTPERLDKQSGLPNVWTNSGVSRT